MKAAAISALLLALASVASAAPATVGQLIVVTTPAGADVSVDGKRCGRAPITVRELLPGEHLVEIAWPDGSRSSSVQKVEAGQSRVATLQQSAATAPPDATMPPPTPPPPPTTPQPPAGAGPAPVDPYAQPTAPVAPKPLIEDKDDDELTPAPPSPSRPAPVAPPPAHVTVYSPYRAVAPAERPAAAVARDEHRPFYKKAWFWSVIGVGVVAGVAIGVGVGVGTRNDNSSLAKLEF